MAKRADLACAYVADSAATSSEELGNPVYPPMRALLEARGLDCSEKTARKVRRSDYDSFDLIIGMDAENRWDLSRLFDGDPDGKLHNFLEYLGRPDEDIPDPWYTRDFSGCLSVIQEACAALFEVLSGTVFLDFSECGTISELFAVLRHQMGWEPWYGENLDALHDVLTGLPHRGEQFVITPPLEDAPAEVRIYASRIIKVFDDYRGGFSE